MADANSLALDQLKQFETTNKAFLDQQRDAYQQELNRLATPTAAQQRAAQPSATQLKNEQEAADAARLAEQNAINRITKIYESVTKGVSPEQQRLVAISGQLHAAINSRLSDDLSNTNDNLPRQDEIRLAQQLLRSDFETFKQQNPGVNVTDYEAVDKDLARDLASADSPFDIIEKGARTALAGIPGIAGIAAGAAGFEGAAGALGGVAADIQAGAPTDLGSAAADAQFGDIANRVNAGDLSIGQAIGEVVSLGITDGDVFNDLLSRTLGSTAGGGIVTGAAKGTAKLAANRGLINAIPSLGTGAAANAVRATPAIGVGVGAGVDENLNVDQSRLLAGTIGASALTAGLTGLVGANVAETAIGNTARNLTGRATGNVAADATQLGARQTTGRALAGAGGTAVAEGAQEFVEGAGESFAESAQTNNLGVFGTLADDTAQQQAFNAGALSAPLGSVVGAPIGAIGGVSDARAQNQQVAAAQAADQAQRAQGELLAQGLPTPERTQQEFEAEQLAQGLVTPQEVQAQQAAQEAELDTQVASIQSALNATITQPSESVFAATDDDAPIGQIGQPRPAEQRLATVENVFSQFLAPEQGQKLSNEIQQFQERPELIRAIYRNELPEGTAVDRAAEQAFVDEFQAISTLGEARAFVQARSPEPEVVATPDPIVSEEVTAPDPIASEPVGAEPINNTTTFTNANEDGSFSINEEGDAEIAAVRLSTGAAFEGLTATEKGAITRENKANKKIVDDLLKKDSLTEAEATQLQTAVSEMRRVIGRKKPSAPKQGPITRAARVAPPRSTSLTGSVSRPRTQGLLQESTGEQVLSYNPITAPAQTQDAVNRITSKFKKSPDIKVVPTQADLPDGVRPTDGSIVAGITDGSTAYLVAENLSSDAHVEEVITEELFHKGIQRSLGGNYDNVLDRVFTQRKVDGLLKFIDDEPTFQNLYRDVISAAQGGNKDAQRELVDEVLAQVAVRGEIPTGLKGAYKQVVAKIKQAIRKVAPQLLERYTDNDLIQLVRDANRSGREPGNFSGPQRVRAARAKPEAGEFEVNGQIFNPQTGASRPVETPTLDRLKDTGNFVTTTYNKGLQEGLNSLFNSGTYGGVMKRLQDARFDLFKVDNQINRQASDFSDQVGQEATDAAINADEATQQPLLNKLLSSIATPALRKSFLSLRTQATLYSGQAMDLANRGLIVNDKDQSMRQVIQEMNEAQAALRAVTGQDIRSQERTTTKYLIAQHAKERNDTLWLTSADLRSETPAKVKQERTELAALYRKAEATPENVTRLNEILSEYSNESRADYKGSGLTDAQAQAVLDQFNSSPEAALYKQVSDTMQAVIQATNEVKKQTGSYSNSYDRVIQQYGWQNYVPLKGLGVNPDEGLGDRFTSHFADNAFSETFRPVQGRESLVENVIDQVIKDAVSSVETYSAQDMVKSAILHAQATKASPTYQSGMEGDGFDGRFFGGRIQEVNINSAEYSKIAATKNPNQMIWYNPDNNGSDEQTALVLTLNSQEGADAILGARSATADGIEKVMRDATVFGKSIHDLTSFTASLKTYRNLPFIPFDMLRNILTLGYVVSSEEGAPGLRRYISAFTSPGSLYPKDIMKYVNLYQSGKFNEIDSLIAKEPNGILAELDEFYQLGGPVNFLAAIRDRNPNSLDTIAGEKLDGKAKKYLKNVDDALSKLNVAADTMSRFALYKSLVEGGTPKDVAAARAKNTANFENRGTWSGPLSGLFEFFRATAIGASALLNSTLTGQYGPQTLAAATGAGTMLYSVANIFAGVDDDGEDELSKVNGKLYNNNFVFQIGDEKLQVGLGFGPVAGAMSTGIHIARAMHGHNTTGQALDNSVNSLVNQAKLVPSAGVSPLSDPAAFGVLSATPSLLRPWVEREFNITSLGIPVRSEYDGSDSGELSSSFSGRFGSETEVYENVTEFLRNNDIANINPDDLKHMTRSYFSGAAYMAEAAVENLKYATSDEEYAYDKKEGLWPFRQFIASNFDQRTENFYDSYNRIKDLDTYVKKLRVDGGDNTVDQLQAIESSEFYQNNLELMKRTKSDLLNLNKEFKGLYRGGNTTTAEKRAGDVEYREKRDAIMRDYLSQVRD